MCALAVYFTWYVLGFRPAVTGRKVEIDYNLLLASILSGPENTSLLCSYNQIPGASDLHGGEAAHPAEPAGGAG